MAKQDRSETVRSFGFTFTFRKQVRRVPDRQEQPRKLPRRRKPQRPALGFRTDSPQPLPNESRINDICPLNERCRRSTLL